MKYFGFDKVKPDIILEDKDEISGFKVISTPGHTDGSICLYDKKRKLMFVGDLLGFKNGKIIGPPVMFSLNMSKVKKSVQKISGYDFQTVLSGHSDVVIKNASELIKDYLKSN